MMTQFTLGAAVIKGSSRVLATAIGSCFAALILFFFETHIAFIYATVLILIGILTYFANVSKYHNYSFIMGAVTLVIILINSNPHLRNALDRTIEILIGVSIALVVSRFVFPIHAEKLLNKDIAETLRQFKKLYTLFIREDKTFQLHGTNPDLEDQIIQHLANQPVLLKEACAESFRVNKQKFKYIIILRLERRLLRSIYMLHYTLRVSLRSFGNIITMQEFKALHAQIATAMEELAKKVELPNYVLPVIDLDLSYKNITEKIRLIFDQYSFEERNKIHAFIFCLGHLIVVLNRLIKNLQGT